MDKASKGLGTLLAFVGTVVSVLTLYYARHDANEKAAHDRPIIDITAARVLSFTGPPSSPHDYRLELTLVNSGTQPAAEVVPQQSNAAMKPDSLPLGEIAPSQNLQRTWYVSLMRSRVDGLVRLEGAARYRDKLDKGREFNEPFCLEAATFLFRTTRRDIIPPDVYENDYAIPVNMRRCLPLSK